MTNNIIDLQSNLVASMQLEDESLSRRADAMLSFSQITIRTWLPGPVIETKDITAWLKELCTSLPGMDWAAIGPDLSAAENARCRDMFKEVALVAHWNKKTKRAGGVWCDEDGKASDLPIMAGGKVYRKNKNVPGMDVEKRGMFELVSFKSLHDDAKEYFRKTRENVHSSKIANALATVLSLQEKDVNEISGDAIPMLVQALNVLKIWNDQVDAGMLSEKTDDVDNGDDDDTASN